MISDNLKANHRVNKYTDRLTIYDVHPLHIYIKKDPQILYLYPQRSEAVIKQSVDFQLNIKQIKTSDAG